MTPDHLEERKFSWYKWQVVAQIVVGIVALGALIAAIVSANSASKSARYAAKGAEQARQMFALQRRPWMQQLVELVRDTTTSRDMILRYRLVCHGASPIDWFRSGTNQHNSREPEADPYLTGPARPLFPDETTDFRDFRTTLAGGSSRDPGVFYLHTLLVYCGAETQDTFYTEQVVFVKGVIDTLGRIEAPQCGIEHVYQGVLRGGQAQLSNYGKVDLRARASADSFLVRNQKLIVDLPETRLASVACSLLLAAKYDSATSDYVAAWVTQRIIQGRMSAIGRTSP